MHPIFVARSKAAQPIWFVTQANFAKITDKLDKRARAFVKASGFEPGPGRHQEVRHRVAAAGVSLEIADVPTLVVLSTTGRAVRSSASSSSCEIVSSARRIGRGAVTYEPSLSRAARITFTSM